MTQSLPTQSRLVVTWACSIALWEWEMPVQPVLTSEPAWLVTVMVSALPSQALPPVGVGVGVGAVVSPGVPDVMVGVTIGDVGVGVTVRVGDATAGVGVAVAPPPSLSLLSWPHPAAVSAAATASAKNPDAGLLMISSLRGTGRLFLTLGLQ